MQCNAARLIGDYGGGGGATYMRDAWWSVSCRSEGATHGLDQIPSVLVIGVPSKAGFGYLL
jgi:hypothetical protein